MIYSPARWAYVIAEMTATTLQVSALWAADVELAMRSNAPWTDRGGKDSVTGLTARQSLEAQVAMGPGGAFVQIVARSTRASTRPWRGGPNAPVGAFLELGTRRMARREVIWPTLTSMAPALKAGLDAAFSGGL